MHKSVQFLESKSNFVLPVREPEDVLAKYNGFQWHFHPESVGLSSINAIAESQINLDQKAPLGLT